MPMTSDSTPGAAAGPEGDQGIGPTVGPQPAPGLWTPVAAVPHSQPSAPESPSLEPVAVEQTNEPPSGPPEPSDADSGDSRYAVSGTVTRSDGSPAVGIAVRAYDRDLRHEEPLGPYAPQFSTETRTDPAGRYKIAYRRE